MSPTVLKWKGYRFFFFSREEMRAHIHVINEEGEAKFWLEPEVELADNTGLKIYQLAEIEKIIRERRNEFLSSWQDHFGS
jgi:hypothetical protein